MIVYIVVECLDDSDAENPIGVEAFQFEDDARTHFKKCAEQNFDEDSGKDISDYITSNGTEFDYAGYHLKLCERDTGL